MRIEKATDYGFRKVVRVIINDSDPQWIHPEDNGATHRSNNARGPATRNPATGARARGVLVPGLAAGTECHACQNNWEVQEYLYEGDTLLKRDPNFIPPLIPDPAFKLPEDDPDAEAPLIPNLDPDIVPFVSKTDQDLKDEALASALASMPVTPVDMGL